MGGAVFPKVLAVDDDEVILSGYRAGFGRQSQVFTASTSADALAIAGNETPELVLVDLRIGNEWGIPLIRRLRMKLPDATIALVSGFTSVATSIAALRAGADHVIPKPTSAAGILRELSDEPDEATGAAEVASLARVEWEHIMRVMAECDGNVSHAARKLKIHRQSLQRKLRKRPPVS
jgi:two-component system response regulator RegA